MIRDYLILITVAKLAKEQILPLVRKMDDEHKLDSGIVKMLFDNGLMGVEADPDFGGSGCVFKILTITFFSTCFFLHVQFKFLINHVSL